MMDTDSSSTDPIPGGVKAILTEFRTKMIAYPEMIPTYTLSGWKKTAAMQVAAVVKM